MEDGNTRRWRVTRETINLHCNFLICQEQAEKYIEREEEEKKEEKI